MGTNAENAAEVLKQNIGKEDEPGEWFTMDQERINQFADCTIDHQFIHVDVEKAKAGPFGAPIAHGFLTLSMLTHLSTSVKSSTPPEAYKGIMMGVNYGFDKVRFPSPVKVGSKIRMRRKMAAVDYKAPNQVQVSNECTIEVEGQDKPACVAMWLTRMFFA